MPDERRWTIYIANEDHWGFFKADPAYPCLTPVEVVPASEADRLRAALREIAEAEFVKGCGCPESRTLQRIARAALDPEGKG